ncbi:MAG: nucleotide sugar dehydrogenase [Chitinophagales bacterium]|nr:nucleotide sugar dehydrogenase [Chitinophagales bacterium]
MIQDLRDKKKRISVVGLGYVGLPLALEFAKRFKVIGFDINEERISMMQQGIDPSKELDNHAFDGCDIEFSSNPEDLKKASFHIIAVPTDIDDHQVPNLRPLKGASAAVGKAIHHGDIVVYESTVYPGCTEEDCIPVIEEYSGMKAIQDFKYGYSPERIVPGDKVRTLTKILKIVSGCDQSSLDTIEAVYNSIIEAGTYRASSVKVAEAAKVIENTQRDINISLMNELSVIFDKIGIDTNEVIDAAGTKWNFHKYHPGLVGGHCIGVDPFYLMHKAKQIGHDPQVIAAGRRVNDYIPHFIAKRVVQTLLERGKNPRESKVLVMGITFKENVADIRNTKVADMIKELMDYSVNVHVVDPWASANEVAHEYGISMIDEPVGKYDAIIVAVGHQEYRSMTAKDIRNLANEDLLLFDIKGVMEKGDADYYWKL